MLRISKLADYAVVVLAAMVGAQGDERLTAAGLSALTRLPEPTVAKVLKLLAKGGLVSSTRGASGGYVLERAAAKISVAEIIAAVDGPVSLTACVSGAEGCCDYAGSCLVRGRWDGVNVAIRTALENVTLQDMTSLFCHPDRTQGEEGSGQILRLRTLSSAQDDNHKGKRV
jgi:FeS assembly SUF system regulator